MKNCYFLKLIVLSIFTIGFIAPKIFAAGDDSSVPVEDPYVQDAFTTNPTVNTVDDLADPPFGEIRKMYLKDIDSARALLVEKLAEAPAGLEGQESLLMPKFQAIKVNLDQIMISRSQRDVFNLIPKLLGIFDAIENTPNGVSLFFSGRGADVRALSVPVVHAIAQHVSDLEANVAASDLNDFVRVFSASSFIGEYEWQEPMPIDAPGIMILNSVAVVDRLKTLPWKQAQVFLSSVPFEETPFKEYDPAGDGLAVLKTKYAANKMQIIAKWQELAAWVAAQKAANP